MRSLLSVSLISSFRILPTLQFKLPAALKSAMSTEKSELEGGTDSESLNDVIRDIDSGEINELAVVAEGEERTTWFVWILVMCSTISGLLFGE